MVTVSYLAFIGEEPVDAGDDASQVRWFNLNRKQNTIVLENQETQIILDLETGESLGKDTLAFDHSQIILKAFHHVLKSMPKNLAKTFLASVIVKPGPNTNSTRGSCIIVSNT